MDCSTESTGSVLDDAGSLILLLRLMTILNNRNGDTSLPGFKQDATIGGPSEPLPFDEADFIPLDAVSAILVQQHEVIAVGYQQNTLSNVAFNRDRTADRIPADLQLKPHLPDDFGVPITEHRHPPGFKPNFTITANPRGTAKNPPARRTLHNLRLVKTGEDDGHWPEVLSNPECRIIEGPTTLEKHISTVCAYLNDYRSHPSVQSDYSNRFFKYLLTVCWPKIYRRISSWRGLGFIYRLFYCQFDSQNVNDADWGGAEYDTNHERYLRRFLAGHDNVVDGLKSVFEWLPVRASSKGGSIDFQALVLAAKHGKRLYTQNTANEFHRFVFSAFVMLGHSLSLFGKAVYRSKTGQALSSEALHRLFLGLQAHTTLILYLITSSTFARHMEVLHNTLGLRELVPDFDRREEYKTFGQRMKIWDRDVALGARDSSAKVDGGDNAPKEVNEAAANEAESSHEMEDPPEALTVESFIGWLKTFVVQFIAKRVLELQCRQRPEVPFEMSLLAVDRIALRVPPWKSFKDIISDVIRRIASPTVACSVENVIKVIEDEIEAFKVSDAEAKRAVEMFRAVIKERDRIYVVGSHCETLLAVLMVLKRIIAELDLDDPDLTRVCEGLHDGFIAVSKLCCPVCCYALAALRGDENRLLVRGCHSTMYGMVLPPILGTEHSEASGILNTIITSLRGELRKSISDLIISKGTGQVNSRQARKKSKHKKQESQTSMDYGYASTSSNDSLNDRDIRRVEYPLDQHLTG